MSSTSSVPKQPPLPLSPLSACRGSGPSDPGVAACQSEAGTPVLISPHSRADLSGSQPPASHGSTMGTHGTQKGDGAAGSKNQSRTEGSCKAIRGGCGGGGGGARGGGDASGHRMTRSVSVASESTLVAGREPLVKDLLQPTLEAAMREYASMRETAAAHKCTEYIAIGLLWVLGMVATGLALNPGMHGRQAKIALAVLGAVLNLIAFCLVIPRVRGEPQASLQRICELDDVLFNLDVLMLAHGRRTLSMVGPEVEAKVARNMGRLNEITGVKSNSAADSDTQLAILTEA